MGKRYRFSEKEIKEIIESYVEKYESTNNIAKRYFVDPSVIVNRLKGRGINVVKGSPYNKKYWVERGMSEIDSINHIRKLRPVNIEYWVNKGYTEEESILQIEGQKLVSLRGCIARFGEVEGTKKWDSRELKRSAAGKKGSANVEYWINKGFSKEEAIIKRSERQSTFSKKICIEKYGEEKGLDIFTERQNKWTKSLNENGNLKLGYSKISQELFFKLLESYELKEKGDVKFALHNKEYKLNKEEGGIWLYDFTDLINNKIIEYNGDNYHGNPKKYKSNDYPHPFRKDITAQEMWDNDKRKISVANNNGFEVLTIWDSEYRWGDKDKLIDKCLTFLK